MECDAERLRKDRDHWKTIAECSQVARDSAYAERNAALRFIRSLNLPNLPSDVHTCHLPDPAIEIDRLRAKIKAHNADCESRCRAAQKAGRCDAYVDRGMKCADCPVEEWAIQDEATGEEGEG